MLFGPKLEVLYALSLFVQTINILIINQSVVDMCASFFTLMVAAVENGGTGMSRDSIYDQFVCRIWLTRIPLWMFLGTSTYGILITALERYIAVVHPIWYNVRKKHLYMPCCQWQCQAWVRGTKKTPKCRVAPAVKRTGQKPGGELCEISKF